MWAAWQHFIAAIFSAEYLMSMQTIAWAINQRVLWCEELQWLTHTPSKTRCAQIKTNMLSLPMYSCWRESNYCTSHISYWSNPYITHLWSNTVIWSNTWLKHRSDNVTLILMCLLWTSSLHFVFVWIFKSICPNVFVLRGGLSLSQACQKSPQDHLQGSFPPPPLKHTHTHTYLLSSDAEESGESL